MAKNTIIGDGRVGRAFAIALIGTEFEVSRIVTRHKEACPVAGITPSLAGPRSFDSDLILIATQDGEIERVADQISDSVRAGAIVLHTSGSQSSSILSGLRGKGVEVGSIHPLISVSDPESGAKHFSGCYFCVEGDPSAAEVAVSLAKTVGGIPFEIETEKKALYHAAAVTSSGHIVALFDIAQEMLSYCGLSSEEAKRIIFPLIRSTLANLEDRAAADALTGPFARADVETFERDFAAILKTGSNEAALIFSLLGARSLDLAAKSGASNDELESFRKSLKIASDTLR